MCFQKCECDTYPLEELWEALVYDGFDNFTIDVREPDAHEGTRD